MNRMGSPRLEIHPARIAENAATILALCRSHGVEVACVTKVARAHPAVSRALLEAGARYLADSRLENLKLHRSFGYTEPLLLLRLPTPSRAAEVVRTADISLVSELETMRALGAATVAAHLPPHHGIQMVDLGDLREGVSPESLVDVVVEAKKIEGFELRGLGCNLTCFGGVIPTRENMEQLVALHHACREATGLELPTISGGNSGGLPLLASGDLPREINHFRVGEAIMLGRNVIDRSPWPGTRQDTFVVAAEIIELQRKPSVPIGPRGQDAFGGYEEFVDRGVRRRAILDIGRQDAILEGLIPCEPGVEVLGGSSDHLIVDVEDASGPLEVGDTLRFYPDYGSLLALATSPYVEKIVIN